MIDPQRIKYLFEKYLNGTAGPDEKEELATLASRLENNAINELFKEAWESTSQKVDIFNSIETNKILNEILHNYPSNSSYASGRKMWRWVAAAAVILLAVGTGFYFNYSSKKSTDLEANSNVHRNDLLPGGNRAILLLANGSTILLDTAKKGLLAQQAGTKIEKLANGQLAYNSKNDEKYEVLFNTVSTPRGGEFHLLLPDNTEVFLNSASSIRFPVDFKGNERKVEITGEVYFEVSKNLLSPFRVVVNDMMVEVLGTHFNVNAYSEESVIRTTLIEGSVIVTNKKVGINLKPGQQSVADRQGNLLVKENIDVDEAIAWKNGKFEFHNAEIETIMSQISRWYNVEVSYEGQRTNETFSGIVSRRGNVSQVLKIMELAGIRFKIEKEKIIVIQN